jgi:hypothetical protein
MSCTCSKCKRERPRYITDPSCSHGGYCNWVDTTTPSTLEEILAAEIERLEKKYGYRNQFILIGLGDGGRLSMCTSPMTEISKEHMLDAAKRLP